MAAASGCVAPPDDATSVRDLRVLAIQAEPPEVVLPGEPVALEFDLRALVVAPDATAGDPVRYEVTACHWDASLRCAGKTGERKVAEGVVENESATAHLSLSAEDVQSTLDYDPLGGAGGAFFLVDLRVWTSTEEMHAAKRIVLTVPPNEKSRPQLCANQNPPAPAIVPGVPKDGRADFDVERPSPGLLEPYLVVTYQGELRAATETWTYGWFTTNGYFRPVSTELDVKAERTTPSNLRLDAEKHGDYRVYVVVRDGRGGESWASVEQSAP